MSSKKKKAQAAAQTLRAVGKPDLAKRLAEAFNLDPKRTIDIEADESLADVGEDEIVRALPDLSKFIPASASLPEPDEKSVLDFTAHRKR
jgi:hypothetical protein